MSCLLPFLPLVLAPAPQSHEPQLIDLDQTVFVQLGIFLLLVLVLYRFLWKPYLRVRGERVTRVEGYRQDARADGRRRRRAAGQGGDRARRGARGRGRASGRRRGPRRRRASTTCWPRRTPRRRRRWPRRARGWTRRWRPSAPSWSQTREVGRDGGAPDPRAGGVARERRRSALVCSVGGAASRAALSVCGRGHRARRRAAGRAAAATAEGEDHRGGELPSSTRRPRSTARSWRCSCSTSACCSSSW